MSDLENLFEYQLRAAGLPAGEREFRFIPGRKWSFDFAWPSLRIAVEIEGGIFMGGRHIRPKGYEADCIKYNAAIMAGWRVFRFTSPMVRSGEALALMEAALRGASLTPLCQPVHLPPVSRKG